MRYDSGTLKANLPFVVVEIQGSKQVVVDYYYFEDSARGHIRYLLNKNPKGNYKLFEFTSKNEAKELL